VNRPFTLTPGERAAFFASIEKLQASIDGQADV